jgi:murein DD-endopeptidase MepM/ murein hydrolase activator NlpD
MMKNIRFAAFTSVFVGLSVFFLTDAKKGASSEPYHSCLHDYFLAEMYKDSSDSEFFPAIPEQHYAAYFEQYPAYRPDGFDYPVGIPDGTGYYKALKFGDKNHLGEDWNGKGGGNTDLGDPVHVVANGLVVDAKEVCCGWGNVIRVVHKVSNDPTQPFVETVYAHLHTIHVKPGDLIKRGKQIGTIGNAKGRYSAHLHFEVRDFVGMSLGPGYSNNRFGYLDPSGYIRGRRP